MNKRIRTIVSVVSALLMALLMAVPGFTANKTLYASGAGTASNPWHIRTAQQLNNVRKNLSGNFVLDNDIDLKGKAFEPIGTFTPGKSDEEAANPASAFTGTFNGRGHKIKNVCIQKPSIQKGVGLFGAAAGKAVIENLDVQNATVTGGFGTGAVAGYISEDTLLNNVRLIGNNTITAPTMVGGISGALNNKLIKNCTAKANIVLTGSNDTFAQCAGVLAGGSEGCSIENCHALGGSVKATGKLVNNTGVNGLGGLAGCAMSCDYVKRCSAKDITITASDKCMMIGGLLGFSGNAAGLQDSTKYTLVKDCVVDNIKINAPQSAERIGGIVGSGFYVSQYKQYYAAPIPVVVENCFATAAVSGGKYVGGIMGYKGKGSDVRNCAAIVTVGNSAAPLVGADTWSVPVERLD